MASDRTIRRRRLDNDLTLVTEQMPGLRSASFGIWVKMGSRFEAPEQAGISHFIEHMGWARCGIWLPHPRHKGGR